MKTVKRSLLKLVCGGLLAVSCGVGADVVKRFEAQPGSKVQIDGTSTIHDWTVRGPIIGGYLELDEKTQIDPALTTISGLEGGKVNAKVEAKIPVRSLKSNNSLMDDVMHNAMKMQAHPDIKYRLKEMTLKEGTRAPGTPFVFATK